jgi:hypothetical protein
MEAERERERERERELHWFRTCRDQLILPKNQN